MKGLMGKFKGMPIKQILFNHAEKFALSFVGLIVLIALASTTWGGISKHPEDLMDKAKKAGDALHTGIWPKVEEEKFAPSTYADVAVAMMTKLVDDTGKIAPLYAYDKPMSFPLYKRIEPRTAVVWPAVIYPIADAGDMVIAKNPPVEAFPEELLEGEEGDGESVNPRLRRNNGMSPAGGMMSMAPTSSGHTPSKSSKKDKKDKKGKSGHSATKPEAEPGMMSMDGMMAGSGMGTGASITPRGVKFVAVRD
jgi:hypothetical protein